MGTRTGNFPIGFRRGWSEWQKNLKNLSTWAKSAGFDHVDLGAATSEDVKTLKSAGLQLGSADVVDFGGIVSPDSGKRKEAIAKNVAYMKEASAAGAKVFFACLCADGSKGRKENFDYALDYCTTAGKAADELGAFIAIEGWPGGGNLPNPGCNPETYRALIKESGTKSIGVNYDPSHLIRMGIDHIRFLNEFAARVWHVHGKDTEVLSENVYEYGLYQGSAFTKGHGFGEHAWRYTIPGHGCTRWTEVFKILAAHNYKGVVSIELEDENFNTNEDGEKAGLTHGLNFLRSA